MTLNVGRSLRVVSATDLDETRWDEYVDRHPAGRICHRYAWRSIVENEMGHQCIYLLALDSESKIRGILPSVNMLSRLFGHFVISMPYLNYGGPLGDSQEIEEMLLDGLLNLSQNHKTVRYIEYRETKPRNGFPVRTDKVTMVLPLESTHDAMFSSFKAKLRSQIKRPLREGVEVKFGREDSFEDFYRVFSTNMRDLGTPPYGKSFFLKILEAFPENAYIGVAYKDNKPIGAAFLLGYKDQLEIPWASTIKEFNSIGVNMLMYWEIIKKAIDQGDAEFDFGRCTKGSGTYKFKLQWGAREVPFYWNYQLVGEDEIPAINPDNPKYKVFISVWKKLPVMISNFVGPFIVRNIP